jgi:hypothetical protein
MAECPNFAYNSGPGPQVRSDTLAESDRRTALELNMEIQKNRKINVLRIEKTI